MSTTGVKDSIRQRFGQSGMQRAEPLYDVFVPDWAASGSPSIRDAAQDLQAALQRMHDSMLLERVASNAEHWATQDRGGGDLAPHINSTEFQDEWEAAADRRAKSIANGAFGRLRSIVHTRNWDTHAKTVDDIFEFMSAEAELLADTPATIDAIRRVQEATYHYILFLACDARDPGELRNILACIDEEQHELWETPYGHDGHVEPEDWEEYRNDPEAWREEHRNRAWHEIYGARTGPERREEHTREL